MIQMQRARAIVVAAALLGAACGTGKPAESATNDECPAGTTKKGGDCIAPDDESGPSTAPTHRPASTGTALPPGEKAPYDKEAVDLVMKKAAAQVKGNCGATTDENGKALGPWGKLKVSITLARNGRVKEVAVPAPYTDKPVGKCIGLAFRNLVYPPYGAPSDVILEWEVELVPPGK